MSATCEKCGNTGHLPGSNDLDCASCDTAMIRVGLETWATDNGIVADEEELWAIFKYGQSVALEEAANNLMRIAVGLIRECTSGLEDADDEEETYLNGRASGIGHLHTELLKLFPKQTK